MLHTYVVALRCKLRCLVPEYLGNWACTGPRMKQCQRATAANVRQEESALNHCHRIDLCSGIKVQI